MAVAAMQTNGMSGVFQELWEKHQDSIVHFGKVLLLALAVIVLSGAVADEGDRMVNLVRAAVP